MGTVVNTISPSLQNFIINGNFDFWQRGTSVSVLASGGLSYQADRFLVQNNATSNVTYSQAADVPTLTQSSFQSRYSLLVTNGSGASLTSGSYLVIRHRIEGNDYQALHGKNIRVQFWVKASLPGIYPLTLMNSAGNRVYVTTYTVNSASTWEKKNVDLTLDNTVTWNFDNSIGLQVVWGLSAGSTYQTSSLNSFGTTEVYGTSTQVQFSQTTGATFQLSQVALYAVGAGTGADFLFQRCGRNISEELQKCQRYYEKSYDIGTAPGSASAQDRASVYGSAQSSSILSQTATLSFKSTKRSNPTILFWNTTGTATQWSAGAAGATSGVLFTPVVNASSPVGFEVTNSGNPGFTVGALMAVGHWTADAEL